MLAQGSQFSLDEVEVVTATVDLDDVTLYRGANLSLAMQVSMLSRLQNGGHSVPSSDRSLRASLILAVS